MVTNNNAIPVSKTNGSVSSSQVALERVPGLSTPPSERDELHEEVESLKDEVQTLRKELTKCRETIGKMTDREKVLRDRYVRREISYLKYLAASSTTNFV